MNMATIDLTSLKSELKKIVISAANLQISESELADTTPLFQGGLGLDSIDLLELVVTLDKKYGMKLQNNDQGKLALQSVESLAAALYSHINS
jgi:acyl carrier protein